MNRKFLAIILVVLTAGLMVTATDCRCVFGDCGSQTAVAAQTKMPSCHHTETGTKNTTPREGCCGKCQIEKTAVLDSQPVHILAIRSNNILAGGHSLTEWLNAPEPSFYLKNFLPHSSPGFFTEHILGTALTFRAPPQGSLQFASI